METNWQCINTISNIVMASIALLSLLYSLYVGLDNRRQRKEDVRARLLFSIIEWQNMYMLKINNVGKEPAYDIIIKVTGEPIHGNLDKFVRTTFDKLSHIKFCIQAGKSVYYLISPSEHCKNNRNGLEGQEEHNSKEIMDWLAKYDNKDINIVGRYCGKYVIDEHFSIREFLLYGSFEIKEPIEEIADAFVSRDPSDNVIQKNIESIKNAIVKK